MHEDILFVHDMSLLAVLDNARFLNALEGECSIRDTIDLDQLDHSESTGSERLDCVYLLIARKRPLLFTLMT